MPELLWPIAIAALLLILVVLYICGRLASHEVQVGKILGVHRRSRLNQLYHEPTSSDQQAPNALETRITHLSFQNWRGFYCPSGMGNVALDVSFKKGDKVWIQGESGSGKYTLLAAIAGGLFIFW